MVLAPNSYEAELALRRAALVQEAPFLFGHGVKATVRETYSDRMVVESGGRTFELLFEGGKIKGFTPPSVQAARALAVLEGRGSPSTLLTATPAPADHVVREEASAALRRAPGPFLREHTALLRAALRLRELPAVPTPFAYLQLGVTEEVVHRALPVVRGAIVSLLDEAAALYRKVATATPTSDSPALVYAAKALPATLAEVVRTGRARLSCIESVAPLVEYHHELAGMVSLYDHLHRATQGPPR